MHITICDDQALDRKHITDTLNQISSSLQTNFIISEFDNPHDLFESFTQSVPDALLLDIDMPEGDGITIANTLSNQYPLLPILFVTNHDNMVFEAVKCSPFRFIRKSHLQEELAEAIPALTAKLANETFLFDIRNGSSTIKCQITDIIYIESSRHYLDIYTTNGVYHIRAKMSDYDKRLTDYGFVRIHVGYLVNVRYIYQLSSKGVLLDDKKLLPVSRDRIDEIKLQYSRQLERFVHGIHI